MRKHINPIEDAKVELALYKTASRATEQKIMDLDEENTDEYVNLAFQLQFSNSMIVAKTQEIEDLEKKSTSPGLIKSLFNRK